MAEYKEQMFCDHCNKMVLSVKEKPNHLLHALLSLFMCGLWVPVWMIITMSAQSQKFKCSCCGATVTSSVQTKKIKTKCLNCGQEYDIDYSDIGSVATCEKCGKDFTIQPSKGVVRTPPPQVPGTVNLWFGFKREHVILMALAFIPLMIFISAIIKGRDPATQSKTPVVTQARTPSAREIEKAKKEEMKAKLAGVATVTVTKMGLIQQSYEKSIVVETSILNNTQWIISGINGRITFYDVFDKKISVLGFKYDKDIKAGEKAADVSYYHYNQFKQQDIELANLNKYKAVFEAEAVVFGDGTKWIVPE